MRHSLLSQEARNKIHKEYRVNLFMILFFALSLAIFTAAVSLVPTRVKISTQYSLKNEKKTNNPTEKTDSREMIGELEKDNKDNLFFIQYMKSLNYTDLVEQVTSLRQNIKISSLNIFQSSTSTVDYIVQGQSPDRDSLISFKARLEAMGKGAKVDLPLTNLIKNKDIKFSLKVIENI